MSVTRKHGLWAVEANTDLIGGITQLSVRTGTEVRGERTSGEVYTRMQSIVGQKPAANFTTMALAAALDVAGLTGKNIADLAAGLKLYAQKHEAGGTRTSGSTHRKYTINDGLLLPQRLSVDHQGDATLSYQAVVVYDGDNDPVVIADAVALPAGLTDVERFTIGPCTIESVSLPQIRRFELDFGISAEPEGADSDIWDTIVTISDIAPVLTLTGIDLEWFKAANIPLIGKAVTHANTSIYLRKRAAGGTFVADGTAEHIKFTAAGLAHIEEAFEASGNDGAECTLVMPLKYDGTNDPLVINTTSAIV